MSKDSSILDVSLGDVTGDNNVDLKEVIKDWNRKEEEDPDNIPPYKQTARMRKEYFRVKYSHQMIKQRKPWHSHYH